MPVAAMASRKKTSRSAVEVLLVVCLVDIVLPPLIPGLASRDAMRKTRIQGERCKRRSGDRSISRRHDRCDPQRWNRFHGVGRVASDETHRYLAGMASNTTVTRSPLHDFHVQHGAKMVDYAGWELPLHYGSIGDEHVWTRTSGGLFDVSHMGRLRISGRHARRFLDRVCTRLVRGMAKGQCRYGLICNETGGCLDDVLVYCFADDDYMVVCNGANRSKIVAHFERVKAEEDHTFKMDDQTESTCMCAIQGPKVMELLGAVSKEVPTLKRYRFTVKNVLVMKIIVSRTGYTGEDGVEVILGAKFAKQALGMLLKDVGAEGAAVRPIGLGARDSLRMEAGMPLYGHELDEQTDPLSAGLGFAVKLDKGESDPQEGRFIGQDALQKIANEGPARRLVGLALEGRRSPRQGMAVLDGERPVGAVTSGCPSPTLGHPIAMAYVPADMAKPGETVRIDLGGGTDAKIVDLPFYKRPS